MCEQELGDHIDQRGSIVLPDRLRFDFSHSKIVDPAAMKRIEDMCIEHIGRDLPVHSKDAPLEQAKQIKGGLPLLFCLKGGRAAPVKSKSPMALHQEPRPDCHSLQPELRSGPGSGSGVTCNSTCVSDQPCAARLGWPSGRRGSSDWQGKVGGLHGSGRPG